MLDYFVSTPLTSVIQQPHLDQYRKLFKFLWALRGVDYGLKDVYRRRLSLDLPSLVEMRAVCHSAALMHTEMVHLLNELQYYFVFEVRRRRDRAAPRDPS